MKSWRKLQAPRKKKRKNKKKIISKKKNIKKWTKLSKFYNLQEKLINKNKMQKGNWGKLSVAPFSSIAKVFFNKFWFSLKKFKKNNDFALQKQKSKTDLI